MLWPQFAMGCISVRGHPDQPDYGYQSDPQKKGKFCAHAEQPLAMSTHYDCL